MAAAFAAAFFFVVDGFRFVLLKWVTSRTYQPYLTNRANKKSDRAYPEAAPLVFLGVVAGR